MDSRERLNHPGGRRSTDKRWRPAAPFVAQVAGLSLPKDKGGPPAYEPAPKPAPLGLLVRETA